MEGCAVHWTVRLVENGDAFRRATALLAGATAAERLMGETGFSCLSSQAWRDSGCTVTKIHAIFLSSFTSYWRRDQIFVTFLLTFTLFRVANKLSKN